jgi:hypothetical protein
MDNHVHLVLVTETADGRRGVRSSIATLQITSPRHRRAGIGIARQRSIGRGRR